MESGRIFNSIDALTLSNPAPGLILANSGFIYSFDGLEPCIGEAFLRNKHGGAIAFFASSRNSFENPAEANSLGPSFAYNANFLNKLLSENEEGEWKNFGAISTMTKTDYIYTGNNGGAYQYLLYAINPIGDPELPLYSSDPIEFDKVRIYRFGRELTINTGGVENSRICVTDLDLSMGFQELMENKSFHTFSDIPESFQVTITAPGYRPYIYRSQILTSTDDVASATASVYPVPANDHINVDLLSQEAKLEIFSADGRLIDQHSVFHGTNRINISMMEPGIYLILVNSGAGTETFRIIKK